MNAKAREIELLLLPMLAAVPLYATQTVGLIPLLVFHAAMAAMVIRVAQARDRSSFPPVISALAIGYIIFYVIDAALISRNAIAASTHLVLFIAPYQPIESRRRPNTPQRLLTTALIFVASIATATHITIVPFVIVFAFLLFRQLIHVSHVESTAIGRAPSPLPATRRRLLTFAARR